MVTFPLERESRQAEPIWNYMWFISPNPGAIILTYIIETGKNKNIQVTQAKRFIYNSLAQPSKKYSP